MDNEKGSNARAIGPMTLAVAAELRGLIARKGYSASRLSREANIPRATLHRTLKATRAIDVEDIYAICEFFSEDPGDLMDAAAANARRSMTSDPSSGLISAIDLHMGVSPEQRFAANEEMDAPFSNAAVPAKNVGGSVRTATEQAANVVPFPQNNLTAFDMIDDGGVVEYHGQAAHTGPTISDSIKAAGEEPDDNPNPDDDL